MKRTLIVLGLLAVGVTAYGYLTYSTSEFVPDVRTVVVTEGDIIDAVVATGALEAVTTVNVGSQVSGIIEDLRVDYNSIVREGDVIMRLDPSLFETQVEQALANLVRAEADVDRLRVSLDDALTQRTRSEDLATRELISETELEAAQVAARLADAQLKSAEAAVTQARASLSQNEVNLAHTVIRSPIDGIVISRLVDVGQTVAAAMQAPELFVIAADLAKMRVIASIDESDVGRVRPNQRVTFTVDAFPGEEFRGSVSQVRLEPILTQNVVTYATVVDAPNSDLRLKPGMTATVTLEIARRENVLRIPSSALRFRPTQQMFALFDQGEPASLQLGNSSSDGPTMRGIETQSGATRYEGERPSIGYRSGDNANARRFDPQAGADGQPTRSEFDSRPDPQRLRRMRERLAQMTPEQREAFVARRREGRRDRTAGASPSSDQIMQPPAMQPDGPPISAIDSGASTIDALFGDLPPTISSGRVWMLRGNRLQEVSIQLGVTDGTASELLSTSDSMSRLSPGDRLVVGISVPEDGQSLGGGGSPLIPRFGRRRR